MSLNAFNAQARQRETAMARLAAFAVKEHITGGILNWNGTHGSPAGVLGESNDAQEWQQRLGLAAWVATAIDTLTGPLTPPRKVDEVANLLGAIPLGADTSALGSVLIVELLNEVCGSDSLPDALAEPMGTIIALHTRRARGEEVAPAEWRKARKVAMEATEAVCPSPPSGAPPMSVELRRARGVGLTIESAAWDPVTSPSSVGEVFRQWLILESLRADSEFAWTSADDDLMKSRLDEVYQKHFAKNPSLQAPGNTVFDVLEREDNALFSRFKAYRQFSAGFALTCAERGCALFLRLLRAAYA